MQRDTPSLQAHTARNRQIVYNVAIARMLISAVPPCFSGELRKHAKETRYSILAEDDVFKGDDTVQN